MMLIGEKLKERRLEKGLTLEDIQDVTKIQVRHIQAIERNDFSLIPGNFYVRAFIKEYAHAVGLDAHALVEEHQSELPDTMSTDTRDFTALRRSRTQAKVKDKSPFQMLLPTIFVILFMFLIGFIVYEFVLTSDDPEPTPSNEETPSSSVEEVTIPPERDEPDSTENEQTNDEGTGESTEGTGDDANVTDDESSEETESVLELKSFENDQSIYHLTTEEEPVTLAINTTNQNWLQIEDDQGQSLFEDMLTTNNAPVEIDMTNFEFIYLRFGEPGVISIDINGKPLEFSDDMNMSTVQEVWIYLNDAYTEEEQ